MNDHQSHKIKINQQNEVSKVKNTFETENSKNSKNDTDIDPGELFKMQRKKYLQQRMNNRRQMKKNKRKQFGSSSSQSQEDKPSQIVQHAKRQDNPQKDFIISLKCQDKKNSNSFHTQSIDNKIKKTKEQQQFHLKHQQYIKQKLARKKQIMQQKRKQFGSSSSDSEDEDFKGLSKKIMEINIQQPYNKIYDVQMKSQKSYKSFNQNKIQQQIRNISPKKKTLKQSNNPNNLSPYNNYSSRKIFHSNDTKTISVLVQSKKNLQWVQDTLIMQNKKLRFTNQNIEFLINFVTKIKFFFSSPSGYKEYMKMKITYKNDDFFFAVSRKKLIEGFRIVNDKLMMIGIQPRKSQSSMFPNYMNLKDVNLTLTTSSLVYGYILKKSKYLNNWETRFISLTPNQIYSSKKPSQKPSMNIQCNTISQFWTRFDIESGNMLNVKIMYNSKKTQFGIPISHFQNQYNWLYCFYKIIVGKK